MRDHGDRRATHPFEFFPKGTTLALLALGLALLALYHFGLLLQGGTRGIAWFIKLAFAQGALYAAAAWIVWRARESGQTLALVVVFAALFRLSVLFVPPLLSDDIYRYVWDGRVQATGINPYRYIPADPALAHLRDEAIYPRINRRDYAPTIYPPVAQMIFFLVTRVSESVTWMKLVMVAFEAVGLWAIAELLASFGLPRQRVLLAAWHPLLVWEIASSGHLDALLVCFVALALLARRRERDGWAGFLLACAALVKFFPLVLFPALYRRWNWRMPLALSATVALAYVPYLTVGWRKALGFLSGYAAEEGLQSGARFFILSLAQKLFGEQNVPGAAYKVFALLVLAVLGIWSLWGPMRDPRDFVRRAFALAAAFTVLLSPHYGWYFVWVVPFLCFATRLTLAPAVCLTVAAFMLYGTWLGDKPADMLVWNSSMYLPSAALAVLVWLEYRFRRGDYSNPTQCNSDRSRK
ncbi:MAG: glycosyltransferase 87 family protein [Pyrinomonadaceae bacterium]